MALAVTIVDYNSAGSQLRITGTLAFDNSYPTGGETVQNFILPLNKIESFEIKGVESGYGFEPVIAANQESVNIIVYTGGSAPHTPGGTVSQPTFSGNALPGHAHIVSTDSDTLTVTANVATTPDMQYPIAVYASVGGYTGVVSILPTGVGLSPSSGECVYDPAANTVTFAGADAITECKIAWVVESVSSTSGGTPVGTVSQPTFTGNAVGGAISSEVSNGTDLSALNSVEFEALGI